MGNALSGSQALIASSTIFAILITKLLDFIRNAFDKSATKPRWYWNIAALGLGVAVALIFQINIFANISHTHIQGWAGQLLTGLGIGAGGSAWHEILDTLSSAAKKLNPSGAQESLVPKARGDLAGRQHWDTEQPIRRLAQSIRGTEFSRTIRRISARLLNPLFTSSAFRSS